LLCSREAGDTLSAWLETLIGAAADVIEEVIGVDRICAFSMVVICALLHGRGGKAVEADGLDDLTDGDNHMIA